MRKELSGKIHKDYIKVSKLSSFIFHMILFVLASAWLGFAIWKEWAMIPIWITYGVIIISAIIFTFIMPVYAYKSHSFEVFTEELEVQSGIIFQSNVLVPMVRVQHVEVENGPLMRKYQLATVKVVTAATKHEIPGLKQDDAEALKIRIGELAKLEEHHE